MTSSTPWTGALLSNERGRQTRVENGRPCCWSFSGTINRECNRRQSYELGVWEPPESAPILLCPGPCPTDNHRIRTSTEPALRRTQYRVSSGSRNRRNRGGKGARFGRIRVSYSRLTGEGGRGRVVGKAILHRLVYSINGCGFNYNTNMEKCDNALTYTFTALFNLENNWCSNVRITARLTYLY